MPDVVQHALVLNLHQPSGNLEHLLDTNEWEAKEILWALDRIPRALWPHESTGRVHLSLSGTLLELLSNEQFQSRVYGIAKLGDLLWHLQNTKVIDILGTGYYHPVFPLIPQDDWDEQITRWKGIASHIFWRNSFKGFWPPEMGFSMEMIPLLKRHGFRYVIVDSLHVEPVDTMSWDELRYRPHIAKYENDEIIVVVRDRELSDAQEAGMDWGWFAYEVNERTKYCSYVPLVTTCSDGENGGWFRNTNSKGNFWDYFYNEYMEKIYQGQCNIKPTFIDTYLDTYGPSGYVKVTTGAWNTGWHSGTGFVQWTGSQAQKDTLKRVTALSKKFHELSSKIAAETNEEKKRSLEEIYWRILRAETSCNFYWGEAFLEKCHIDLNDAEQRLNNI